MSLHYNNFASIVAKDTIRPSLTLNELGDVSTAVTANDLSYYYLRMAATANRTITLPSASAVITAQPKIGMGNGVEFVVQHTGTAGSIVLAAGARGTIANPAVTQPGETRRYFLRVDDANLGLGTESYTVYNLGAGSNAQPTAIGACGQMELRPTSPPQKLTQGGVAGTASTLGDAVAWLTITAGQGSMIPNMRNSVPDCNYAWNNFDTGTTTLQGHSIYGLRLHATLPTPSNYFGIYRYDITLVYFMSDWHSNDTGHIYRIMLARNGTPVADPFGTQANNSRVGDTAMRPYVEPQSAFPLNGAYSLTISGLTTVSSASDWFVPFLQNFSNGVTVQDQNNISIYNCTMSMNIVAPLST